jgi:hypothetical protein
LLERRIIMRRAKLVFALCVAVLLLGSSMASAGSPETADVMDQGAAGVVAADGASIVRQPDGIRVSLTMPAPVAGAYLYPDGVTSGSPEVFTMWAFVFNYPEHCSAPCGGDDTNNPDVEFGVYNVAGHVNAGQSLTMSGRFAVGAPAGAPPGVTPHPLSNPAGAEIHVAITSHGGLDPATLPGEFRRPTGSPACGCWWVAIFD